MSPYVGIYMYIHVDMCIYLCVGVSIHRFVCVYM